MDKDVEEILSWGLDRYICCNIILLLPSNLDLKVKYSFIMNSLQKALIDQNRNGWNILCSLRTIMNGDNYSKIDKQLAEILLKALEGRQEIQDEFFRIHCKGLGVRCKRKEGIKANEFITEYFGELYPSWRWYEKEDVIKHGQNRNKLSKELPDFYNIVFERHADDPEGYNSLTIDPILKGSFASRLSHS